MKKIATIILFIFSASFLLAAEPLFEQANNFYAAEKYEEAILLYDSVQQNGLQSKELFYNMGNTYYKLQNWPNCILYYEKTLKLDANHEDALHNLELAQLKIVDKIEPIPSLFFEKWMDNLTLLLPFESWAILSLILLWAALILFTLRKSKASHIYSGGPSSPAWATVTKPLSIAFLNSFSNFFGGLPTSEESRPIPKILSL